MHVAVASDLTGSFGRRDDTFEWYTDENVFGAVVVAVGNFLAATVMLMVQANAVAPIRLEDVAGQFVRNGAGLGQKGLAVSNETMVSEGNGCFLCEECVDSRSSLF